jgi:hypothetical protein
MTFIIGLRLYRNHSSLSSCAFLLDEMARGNDSAQYARDGPLTDKLAMSRYLILNVHLSISIST